MMEIAFGPVIVACVAKSLVFGCLFALLFPMLQRRLGAGAAGRGLLRSMGLGLLGGSLFGIAHLVIECAADGFPPRIIQVTGLALLVTAAIGAALVARPRQAAFA